MLTEQHIEEGLSRACVQAIAVMAGLIVSRGEYDYGVDGTFHEVASINGRRVESGFCLHFQLKASTKWQQDESAIIYDLEAKTYNDLVGMQANSGAIPCVLILLALPKDRVRWLECWETGVTIGGGCYWASLSGSPTKNRRTVRISIPREQQLSPTSLITLLNKVKTGTWQ